MLGVAYLQRWSKLFREVTQGGKLILFPKQNAICNDILTGFVAVYLNATWQSPLVYCNSHSLFLCSRCEQVLRQHHIHVGIPTKSLLESVLGVHSTSPFDSYIHLRSHTAHTHQIWRNIYFPRLGWWNWLDSCLSLNGTNPNMGIHRLVAKRICKFIFIYFHVFIHFFVKLLLLTWISWEL